MAQIQAYCQEQNIQNLSFDFAAFPKSMAVLKIPFIGEYLHYYLWLLKARPILKKLAYTAKYTYAHHVTYSSIKFGTPLYDLPIKTVLGPLGGGELPDVSLKKYLGGHYRFEVFKFGMADFLSSINPTVASSVKTAEKILVSNEIASGIVRKYTSKPLEKMFDAGLADSFKHEFIEREINGVLNILWIGRMLPRKGLNLAIETISKLPKELPFHFYIVGDGDLMEQAKKDIQKYGLTEKTTFTGKLPYNLLKPVFEKSHLLLFPSLIDSCPMQVFESMAFSIPVVTLNHQGMKDQVSSDTGIKIDISMDGDYPTLLAQGIVTIARDPILYKKLSRNAYAMGQKQLWNTRITQFIEETQKQFQQ